MFWPDLPFVRKGSVQLGSKRRIWLGAAGILLAAAALTFGVGIKSASADDQGQDDAHGRDGYAIGLWGDMPYSDIQATVGVPNLIADMNSQELAFTAHDGDLKAGSGACSDAVYARALAYFASLKAPAAFTPGDNDWTDCDRVAGVNSLVQLDKERELFFGTPYTLGQRKLHQEVQTEPLCLGIGGPVACVENRRWMLGGVTYATLNVQGSCNNLCDTAPDPAEFAARNHANIVWLQETFVEAKRRGSLAVMLISQADPGFERTEVVAFPKPVAYVHGDSHYFRIDKPFLNAQGQRLENFTRVETFGDHQENGINDNHWLKVLVDPKSREVFSYQPQIVPANRVAVPVS
jgi:hypothetical protein